MRRPLPVSIDCRQGPSILRVIAPHRGMVPRRVGNTGKA